MHKYTHVCLQKKKETKYYLFLNLNLTTNNVGDFIELSNFLNIYFYAANV